MKFTISLIVAVSSFAEASQFKSGAVTGSEKFTYGKFISRMKAPNKKGTVASFFTYWDGPEFFPGGWNELDIEIVPSVDQNPLSMNVIYGDGTAKHESHDYQGGFDPKDDWHIYELVWTPDFIAWKIDNKEVRRVTKEDPSVKLTTKPQSVMMNFWTPTFLSWSKGFDASDMPWTVEYDYVETYTYNTEKKNFEFHWRDNFDTFDGKRWNVSDNTTFDANSTIFRSSQVSVQQGNLVLKMEPDEPSEHGLHHQHQHATVSPVMSMPTPTHTVGKGEKGKPADEHFDIGAEEDYSHMRREDHVYPQPPPPMYYSHERYPGYGYGSYGRGYEHGFDHSEFQGVPTDEEEQQFHHDMPLDEPHHEPQVKKHEKMHENPYHYDPYHQHHPEQKKQDSKQKANFAMHFHDTELTPYEHKHPEAVHHEKVLLQGQEHHPSAHSDMGYWNLPGHEPYIGAEGHYSAEEHGEYHYIEPERTHHMGHYYSYEDQREHYPQHLAEHHDAHGIEKHPDDWKTDHHTNFHSDKYHYAPDDDFERHNFDEHTDVDYTHDVSHHDGHGLMGQIEHEFDQLFHEMEHKTVHGTEHHDVHFPEMTLTDREQHDQHHVTDSDHFVHRMLQQ